MCPMRLCGYITTCRSSIEIVIYETSHERQPHTQENDCNGEFHLAIKKQIIDR
jgi:hypothetical protein